MALPTPFMGGRVPSAPSSIYPPSMAGGGMPWGAGSGTAGRSSTASPGQMLPGGVLQIGGPARIPSPLAGMQSQLGNRPTFTGTFGALQAAGNADIGAAAQAQQQAEAQSVTITPEEMTGLAAYISRQWEMMNRHRLSLGIADRLLAALRAFNGQYDATRAAEIKKFGGSDVYARVTSNKSRGATSLLRDIYINQERPWAFKPPDDIEIPMEVYVQIVHTVQAEVGNMLDAGQPPQQDEVKERTKRLIESARQAAKKKAAERSRIAEDKVDTLLTNGNFYGALAEVCADLTIFPYAIMKGPTVRMQPTVQWRNGQPFVSTKPILWYERVSPFDLWMSPGVARVSDAQMVERKKFTRAALNDLLDLPGYDHDAVRRVLQDYPNGLTDIYDYTEASRSILESRENPQWNETGLIDCLEFHGNMQGTQLIDAGMSPSKISDPMRDYMATAWKIGRYIIKVQLNPSPRKRHPYFISSFEKVPGTPIGNSLPDILGDVQEMANVTLRSMANNMAFASGPQVTVDHSRLAPSEDGTSIFPWKRWAVKTDPFTGNTQSLAPISFFQPADNSQSLMAVYGFLMQLGDDQSAVPRYITSGTGASGGASRTASGLAMLMGNASKQLQTVAGNVDIDIMEPILTETKDIVLLTDETDLLDGSETIVAKGAQVAQQRETLRSRQLEFLQITNNPVDMQIMKLSGRASVLKSVSNTLGMPGAEIVPDPEDMEREQEQQETLQQQSQLMAMAGIQPPGMPGGGEEGGGEGGGEGGAPGSAPGAKPGANGPPGGAGNQPPRPAQGGGAPSTNLMRTGAGGPPRVAAGP